MAKAAAKPPAPKKPVAKSASSKKATRPKSPAEWAHDRLVMYIRNFESQRHRLETTVRVHPDPTRSGRRRVLLDRVVVHEQERVGEPLQLGRRREQLGHIEPVADPVESVATVDGVQSADGHDRNLSEKQLLVGGFSVVLGAG